MLRYPALITYNTDRVSVEFLDLPGCKSEGENEDDAIEAAKVKAADILRISYWKDIPPATKLPRIRTQQNQALAIIEIWIPLYDRKEHVVSKNLTIPAWLDRLAKEHNINFSKVLKDALVYQLGLSTRREQSFTSWEK